MPNARIALLALLPERMILRGAIRWFRSRTRCTTG
jgi:hypothetical protein